MQILIAILILVQAAATESIAYEIKAKADYTESTDPGRVVGPTDSVALCAADDETAVRDMERMAVAALAPGERAAATCTKPMLDEWRVVRAIADRCLVLPGGKWCEVEAHAVLVERKGVRRYAVILVTADQLD